MSILKRIVSACISVFQKLRISASISGLYIRLLIRILSGEFLGVPKHDFFQSDTTGFACASGDGQVCLLNSKLTWDDGRDPPTQSQFLPRIELIGMRKMEEGGGYVCLTVAENPEKFQYDLTGA
jgi:hypothetical protein